jgi:HEAT repeat protein
MRTDDAGLTIQELGDQLQAADEAVRLRAVTILGTIGEYAEPAVPALISLLNTGDMHEQKMVVLTLGEIGPTAGDAVPALLDAANDERGALAAPVVWALKKMDRVAELKRTA